MARRKKTTEIPLAPALPPVITEMPSLPDPASIPERDREALSAWWRSHSEDIERRYQERIETLRNGGEHPTPACANQVKMAGMLGMPKSLVAKFLGISQYTLNTYYDEEYELGKAEVMASVAANMIRIGTSTTDPNAAKVGMQILDRRGGEEWRPPAQKLEMTSDTETPKNVIDTSGWDPSDREALRQMLLKNEEGAVNEGLAAGSDNDAETPA